VAKSQKNEPISGALGPINERACHRTLARSEQIIVARRRTKKPVAVRDRLPFSTPWRSAAGGR